MAWDIGLAAVEAQGGTPFIDLASYPFVIRGLFAGYSEGSVTATTAAPATPTATAPPRAPATAQPVKETTAPPPKSGSARLSEAQFESMFPSRNSFYTFAALTDAMAKFPTFAATGDATTRQREMAAFLATVDHESGGLVHIEEINQSAWGNYCDANQPYGCPAGQAAYHGRGPIQLSWNNNYKAAGDALGIDLLNEPDLVKNDPSVAWQTALWFWMTQTGAGSMTAHAAMTGGAGFGETIRTVNGALECGGRQPERVRNRVEAYKRIAGLLGVKPEEEGELTC
ncbi:chitinase [Phytohabitans flavus]|uniref:chitinase n=1 Tax=Phytohabitans flavus TaxID=1076124 RepID=UPI00362B4809